MPSFHSGALSDFLSANPSSSGGGSDGNFTLAHELLGLPSMSQAFSAKVRHFCACCGLSSWSSCFEHS